MPGVTMHLKAWNDIEDAAREGVYDAASVIHDEAMRLIHDTSKTGRVYDGHRASAPGEPYASDSGQTAARITVHREPGEARARITFNGENALRLEMGTENMEPRPVATPAFMNVQKQIVEAAGFRIRRYLRKDFK